MMFFRPFQQNVVTRHAPHRDVRENDIRVVHARGEETNCIGH